MQQQAIKHLVDEAKSVTHEAKEIVYKLLNEPMEEKHKRMVLELFRLLK